MDAERLKRILESSQRAKMTGWFDPRVLARSAVLVSIANLFGRNSDQRLIEALANQPQGAFDYSKQSGDFWLDYVSDLGDGWDSTYAIARAVAEPRLVAAPGLGGDNQSAQARGAHGEETHSGRVLIFGGDEVYPYPSRNAYEIHTEKPWATALLGGLTPDLFAVPGNHDWYDSLIAFSRTFCRPERGFAGCRTQQTRSYFALKLPASWWLLAIDLQLGADLDEPQVQYFERVAEAMDDNARIALCVPEPQWIIESSYPTEPGLDDSALNFLQTKILKHPVDVFLAGDLHHYRRHANEQGVQKIVCGGGGAFLHPTHVPHHKILPNGFVEQTAFPSREKSSRLAWRNLWFAKLNPRFMWVPAVIYALSAWLASANLRPHDLESMWRALGSSMTAAVRDPFDGLWLLTFLTLFIFFTDTHSTRYRVLGGLTHALSHLLAAFAIGWCALLFTTKVLDLPFGNTAQLLLSGAITFAVGGVVGSLIMGLYLLISVQVFGRHSEQAFAALRVEDYKSWLRIKIDAMGDLTIYAMGIERVPRAPDDARATAPHLIEKIVLPRKVQR
jgi:hypothetical protein